MTVYGYIFMLSGLLIFPVAMLHRSNARVAAFVAAFIIHCIATLFFFGYAQTTSADVNLYWLDPTGFAFNDLAPGTQFVIALTQFVKTEAEATFLDVFFLYSTFGFWGVALLARLVEEAFDAAEVRQPPIAFAMLFLPSLYFWTSSIGKDAPLFLAVSMAVWATFAIKRRWAAFVGGVVVAFAFRPHIAMMLVAALGIGMMLVRQVRPSVKVAFVFFSMVAVFVTLPTLQTSIGVDISSASSVGDFLEKNQESGALVSEPNSTSTTNASYPVRLFSLLFRPLFLDANGVLAIAASLENMVFLVMFGFIALNIGMLLRVSRHFLFLRFSLTLLLLLVISLSLVWYNLGLGLRQRVMYFPALWVVVASLLAAKRVQRQATAIPIRSDRRDLAPANVGSS